MGKVFLGKALVPASIAMAGLLLAGCGSMTTYGTGKTPGAQTIEDIGGIVSLGGQKRDAKPIEYKERPTVVEPPSTAVLPPPKTDDQGNQLAMTGDWPNDPDEADKRMREAVREAADSGEDLRFTVPGGSRPTTKGPDGDKPFSKKLRAEKAAASANAEETKKLFADLKRAKAGSVDENGVPIRRYLTEPPTDYRAPDPNAPLEVTEKKKKGFKWPDLWPF